MFVPINLFRSSARLSLLLPANISLCAITNSTRHIITALRFYFVLFTHSSLKKKLFISCTFQLNYAEIFISICDWVFCAACKPFSSHILSHSHTSSNRGHEWQRLKIISFKRGDSYSWELVEIGRGKVIKASWMCWQHIEGPRLEESLAAWLRRRKRHERTGKTKFLITQRACSHSDIKRASSRSSQSAFVEFRFFVIYYSFIASLVCITWENSSRKMIFSLCLGFTFLCFFCALPAERLKHLISAFQFSPVVNGRVRLQLSFGCRMNVRQRMQIVGDEKSKENLLAKKYSS